MSARLNRLRSDQRGFTLIELLVSMMLGIIVLGGVLTLMDVSARSSTRTEDRVDVTQRGRTAMNQIVRRIRSQVCQTEKVPPINLGWDTFMSEFTDTDGDPFFTPQGHWLSYDSSAKGGRGAIKEYVFTPDPGGPPWTYNQPLIQRTLIEDVRLQPGTPFLRFYTFDDPDTPIDESATPLATPLSTDTTSSPLPANSVAKVVRVDVSFRVMPSRARDQVGPPVGTQNEVLRNSDFDASVYVRNTDYTSPADQQSRVWGPRCS